MKTLTKVFLISIIIIGTFSCEKDSDSQTGILLFQDNFDTLNLEKWSSYSDIGDNTKPAISPYFGNNDNKNNCILVFATIMELFMGPTYIETKTISIDFTKLEEYSSIQLTYNLIYEGGDYGKIEVVNKTNSEEVLYQNSFEEKSNDSYSNQIPIQLNTSDTLQIRFITKAIGNTVGELYFDNFKAYGIKNN